MYDADPLHRSIDRSIDRSFIRRGCSKNDLQGWAILMASSSNSSNTSCGLADSSIDVRHKHHNESFLNAFLLLPPRPRSAFRRRRKKLSFIGKRRPGEFYILFIMNEFKKKGVFIKRYGRFLSLDEGNPKKKTKTNKKKNWGERNISQPGSR